MKLLMLNLIVIYKMASVYSNPDYVAKLPHTSFSLYQPIEFTSMAGALVPLFCDFLQPGEKISGDISGLTRTNELETPAMTDIDEFVDYFFVPVKKLYSIFGEWFFGIDDNPTALRPSLNAARVRYLPSISPERMYQFFKAQYDYEENILQPAESTSPYIPEWTHFDRPSSNIVRLMSHFRFDVFTLFDSASGAESRNRLWNIPLLPFLAYQAVYYDYYRDSNWQENDVLAYNIDDWLTTLSQDNITDERLAKIFELHHRRQNADYYTNVKPSPLQNATSMLNIDGVREAALLRINDWLSPAGLTYDFISKGNANTAVAMGSPIPTDGISDSDLSVSGNGSRIGVLSSGDVQIDSAGQNLDTANTQGLIHGLGSEATHLFWDSQENGRTLLFGALSNRNVNSVSGSVNGFSIQGLSQALSNLQSSITSSGIRTMFALEKLAKITARAGKHYDDQVLAHFGYKVPKGVSNEVYYLGGQHGGIHIGEIISPSTTEGSIAGEMVGKGYGGIGNGKVDFTAPCHGYFIAIYSSAPRRSYTPCGSPKEYSQFERQDFPMAETMNLGMQPLFPIEFTPKNVPTFADNLWQYRYSEWKQRIPMAIGGFARYDYEDTTLNGNHQDWTIQYPIYNLRNRFGSDDFTVGYQNFLVSAMSFNSIFTLQWSMLPYQEGADYHVARVFDRDPLFHDFKCSFFKTSFMSTFGEPSID